VSFWHEIFALCHSDAKSFPGKNRATQELRAARSMPAVFARKGALCKSHAAKKVRCCKNRARNLCARRRKNCGVTEKSRKNYWYDIDVALFFAMTPLSYHPDMIVAKILRYDTRVVVTFLGTSDNNCRHLWKPMGHPRPKKHQ